MDKKEFWVRFAIFFSVAFLAPMIYLTVRYHLFQPTTSTSVNIGFWGVVVIGILCCSIAVLVKFYLEGMKTKWSWAKQIIEGFVKLILPLCFTLFVVIWLGDNITHIKEALYIIIPCEALAIIVNPLPKWAFDNNVEGVGNIAESIFKRIKKSDGEENADKPTSSTTSSEAKGE